MGGSRYIRLRILLALYILAILVPTKQFNPESSAVPAVSLCMNWLLDSDYLISKRTKTSTNSTNLNWLLDSDYLISKRTKTSTNSTNLNWLLDSDYLISKRTKTSTNSTNLNWLLDSDYRISKWTKTSTNSTNLNWLLDSDYQISKRTTTSTNSTNTLLTDFSSKSHHNLWTLRYQRQSLSPHSPDNLDNLWLHWVQIHTRIHKKVYGCFESYNIILLYVFYTYCYACKMRIWEDNSAPREEDVTSHTPGVLSLLVSKFTTEENKGKSISGLSDDPSKKYDWIFKYPNTLWHKVVSVYPVFQQNNWQRTASYSKLAFQKMPEKVSLVQLAAAGFRYNGHGLEVTCDMCHKSLNISDFTSSPCEAKYHEGSCSFIKPVDRDADLMGDSVPWSSASDTTSSSLSETASQTQECNTAQVQPTLEIQTSDQSQSSPTGDPPPSSTSTFIHGAGSNEVENTSNIPGFPCSGSSSGAPVSHDIENDGPSTLLEPLTNISGCPDQANGPGISPQVHSDIWSQQQQHVTRGAAGISRPEASATSAVDSDVKQSQRNDSRPTKQQQQNHPATNGPGRMTTLATNQEPPQPGSSGSSYTSHTDAEFVDTVDFQPEIADADTEVPQSDDNCHKNPGHYSYFPIGNLRLEYIPSNVRCPEVLQFFNLIAKLTVRVVVSAISSKKLRLCPPNQQTKYKFGTGFAVSKPSGNYLNIEHSEKLSGVRKYLPYGRKNGYIYIETSHHLVRDNAEAENTIVEFFYDQPNRRCVVLAKGVTVCHSCDLGDSKSVLVCRTSDATLVKMVKESTEKMENMAKNLPQNIKEGMMRRIFMLSHPHGTEKVFSFGEYVIVKYRLETVTSDGRVVRKFVKINNHTQISQNDNEVRKLMLYTADTCPGSTGGVIVSFKKTGTADAGDIVLDLWMHNGFDVKHSLNTSAMRAVTSDDIANHGHQSVYRPSIQEDMAAEAERAANQVVHSPVFTVSKPPSHPAYVTYRKRWESYPTEFTHIHTKEDLANAGFFYAGYGDCVRCFQCGLGLKSWRNGDVINQEHFRNRPDCQFLLLKLRESGIDVSQLEARVRPSASQSTELSLATSNTELGLSENMPRQTEETRIKLQMSNNTHTEEKTPSVQTEEKTPNVQTEENKFTKDLLNETSHLQPSLPEMMVCCVQSPPPETKAPAAVRAADVARLLEKEQRYLKQIFICKVCSKNPVKDLFLPCGELVACVDCSKLLTHCPSCSKKILATVTIYFS